MGHLVGSKQNQAFPAHFLWLLQQPSGTEGRGLLPPLLGLFPPLFPPLLGGLGLIAATSEGSLAGVGPAIAATPAETSVVFVLR